MRLLTPDQIRDIARQLVSQGDYLELIRECANRLDDCGDYSADWKASELRLAVAKIGSIPSELFSKPVEN